MIQRIQSLFLLLASVAFFSLFELDFASSNVAHAQLLQDNIFEIQDHVALMALAGIGGVLALVAIFLFRNRPLQMKLGYAGMVAAVLVIVVAIVLFMNASQNMATDIKVEDELGVFAPPVALLFIILANRFIKKDENLVKSMDRLR